MIESITSQRTAILAHLKSEGSIEMRQARILYGCEALRSRIAELRKQGHPVGDIWVNFVSKYGSRGRYKRYIWQPNQSATKKDNSLTG